MYFNYSDLLEPPIRRAAYSDRTAWLLGVMSKLAYVRFEQGAQEIDEMKSGLNEAGFELIQTFNRAGTQAFLARRASDKFLVLAFRGTEKDKFKDILSDLDARFYTDEQGVKIHNGFYRAFLKIKDSISEELNTFRDHSLYVTGHSLGGALALIATREFNSDNLAACYTYGSPRVGSIEFGDDIKPPIYRIVNALDPVPYVPFTYLYNFLYGIGKLLEKVFKFSGLVQYVEKNKGYYAHHGDERFLTECGDDYKKVRVIYNYNEFLRLGRLLWLIIMSRNIPAGDHSLEEYCRKLGAYGVKRN